ncbi:MAG: glucose-1-phosphate thymidylyltransferase [Candidatus Lokiarchaeota archaeon]|nr:glucose-1-phosphate thymidylyltransferase [Candidatus Lokiarchaeota archaeon]
MKAAILAAGEGTRLRPFTFTRPKHLLPIVGKPLLQHTIESLKKIGVNEIIAVIGYKEEMIRDYFQDGSKFGVKIEYINQKVIEGTAAAIKLVQNFINDDAFLLQYGDVLVPPESYPPLIKKYKEKKPSAILSVREVDDPSKFGVIDPDGDNVKRIVEKPKPGTETSKLVNAGIYIFTPDIFDAIDETKKSKRGEYEITDSIQILIDRKKQILKYELPSWWKDIGLPWNLLEANQLLLPNLKYENNGTIEDNVHINGDIGVGEGTIIKSGVYIEGPVLIGKKCVIGPNCYLRSYTVLEDDVRIGHACEIKGSLVMSGTRIPHLSYIGDSIIGSNVNLGAGTITANLRMDHRTIKATIKKEKIDTKKRKLGAIVGDNAQSGIGVTLMPGVIVGKNSAIAANMNVTHDVPSDTFVSPKQELIHKEWKIKKE